MARATLARLTGLLAATLILVPGAQALESCGPVEVADAADDQVIWPSVPAPDAVREPAMDILATTIAVEGDAVVLTATLAAPPGTSPDDRSFRYWFGFNVVADGGEPQYWDVRAHGKESIASAPLVSSNELGNHGVAELEATWDGGLVTYRFPLTLVREAYGTDDVIVGSPEASTDGPFTQEMVMGLPTGAPYQVDSTPVVAGFAPATDCAQESTDSGAQTSESGAEPSEPVAAQSSTPGDGANEQAPASSVPVDQGAATADISPASARSDAGHDAPGPAPFLLLAGLLALARRVR